MKTFLFLLLSGLTFHLPAQSWSPLPDFPGTERDDAAVFVIDETAYCGTGLAPWWVPFGDFYAFDMNTLEWNAIAPLPEGEERQYASGFSDGNAGYIFGGVAGDDFKNDLWKYTPDADVWTELNPLPGEGRSGAAHFVIDNTAYIVGGKNENSDALDEVWSYDMITDAWTQKNDLPFGGRWRASATAHFGLGYIALGQDENNSFRTELYVYDSTIDNWLLLSEFPLPGRTHATLAGWGEALYIFAGMDSSFNAHNDLQVFNIGDLNWSEGTPLPAAGRRGGLGFVYNNIFHYTTGIDTDNNRLTETWKYDLNTGLNTNDIEMEVHLFPNPATDAFYLQLGDKALASTTHCHVYDSHGRLVWQQQLSATETKVNAAEWATGIYSAVVFNEQHRGVVQWVKE